MTKDELIGFISKFLLKQNSAHIDMIKGAVSEELGIGADTRYLLFEPQNPLINQILTDMILRGILDVAPRINTNYTDCVFKVKNEDLIKQLIEPYDKLFTEKHTCITCG